MTYKEFRNAYWYPLKQWPDSEEARDYSGVLETITRYARRGSRWVETETVTTEIPGLYYLNGLTAVPFMRGLGGYERITTSYTKIGRVPVEIVSISPDKQKKTIRRYSFSAAHYTTTKEA